MRYFEVEDESLTQQALMDRIVKHYMQEVNWKNRHIYIYMYIYTYMYIHTLYTCTYMYMDMYPRPILWSYNMFIVRISKDVFAVLS